MDIDKDTDKILYEGQEVKDLVDSPGWKHARNKLIEKLIELDSIGAALDADKKPEEIVQDMKVSRTVVDLIMQWLQEIEGIANSNEHNRQAFLEKRKDNLLVRFD